MLNQQIACKNHAWEFGIDAPDITNWQWPYRRSEPANEGRRADDMNSDGRRAVLPPFPSRYRASGVLFHVTSLPSRYGIGDLGPAARKWVDRLRELGQSWWQALPLGPTGYGNSPYQALSSFAANEILVSPDGLIEDGLVAPSDCESKPFSATAIDYDAVIPFKHRLLETA
jgi:4-alpha-glucanotransferase